MQNYTKKMELKQIRDMDLREGLRLSREGKYEDALLKFESVLGSKPTADESSVASYNVACCYSKLNQVLYFHIQNLVRLVNVEALQFPDLNKRLAINREDELDFYFTVLDEFLRAITGFKGTEDVDGDKLVESPYLDELKRDKRISSAPSYGVGSLKDTLDESTKSTSGVVEWNETI